MEQANAGQPPSLSSLSYKNIENAYVFNFARFYLYLYLGWEIFNLVTLFFEVNLIQLKAFFVNIYVSEYWIDVLEIFPNLNASLLEQGFFYALVGLKLIFLLLFLVLFVWQFADFDFDEERARKKKITLSYIFSVITFDAFSEKGHPFFLFTNFLVSVIFFSLMSFVLRFSFYTLDVGHYESMAVIVAFPLISNFLASSRRSITLNIIIFLTFTAVFWDKDYLLNSDFKTAIKIVYAVIFISTYFYVYFKRVNLDRVLEKYKETGISLMQTSRDLSIMQEQNQRIMENIDDGIILLDENFNFLETHSRKLREILETEDDFKGKNLFTLLKKKLNLPDKTIDYVKRYFDLIVRKDVPEVMIAKANPLEKVEVSIEVFDEERRISKTKKKWLYFTFNSIELDEGKPQILVHISDRTNEENLRLKIKEEEEKQNIEIKMISELLHGDPVNVNSFFNEINEEISNFNSKLKGSSDYHSTLKEIYISIHSLKGKASVLKLNQIVTFMHDLEESFNQVIYKPKIELSDTLNLVYLIGELKNKVDGYLVIGNKIGIVKVAKTDLSVKGKGEAREEVGGANRAEAEVQTYSLKNLNYLIDQTIKQAKPKHIINFSSDVSIDEATFVSLSNDKKRSLTDIIIQLIKNSFAHGFNGTNLQNNSNPKVVINFKKNGTSNLFDYEDNGGGIDPEKIKKILLAKKLVSSDKVLSEEDIANYIFLEGVSTQENKDIDSGQGIGMSLIKSKVEKELKGNLKLDSHPGRYFKLSFTF